MAKDRAGPPGTLDRTQLRAALLDLLRLAALWESGALRRGRAEARAADEHLLATIVEAIQEHQSGEKSVPVARVGRHVVRRVDLRLARVHERVASILRGLDGPIDDEVLGVLRAAFSSGGVRGVTREKLAAVTALLDRLLHHAHVLKCGPRSWRTKLAGDLHSEAATR